MTGGRPIQLYVAGQTFNLILTLLAAYLAFGGILFDRIPMSSSAAGARAITVIEHVFSHNLEYGRDATPLFYTEIEDWQDYLRH